MKTLTVKYPLIAQLLFITGISLLFFSCQGGSKAGDDDDDAKVTSSTPVTVTAMSDSTLTDYVDLNATSTTLQKNYVKSNATGYIQQANVQPGQNVSKGQVLFTVKTKESQTIGNSINILDTTLHFSGVNKIRASQSGYISSLSHQAGDYVQDGEALAVISDRSSFVFIMQLPYELRQYVKTGQTVGLTLPGGTTVAGRVSSFLPSVDTVSQTQGVLIKINSSQQIPENLVAKARIIKSATHGTASLPKPAILADETQTKFWVMKLINDSTAVKVPVREGIQSGDRVEILSPAFSAGDRFVLTGNYGLTDTAKVKIVKP